MHTLEAVNHIIFVLFVLCYAYQSLYIPVAWGTMLRARRERDAASPRVRSILSYAVLICARNEETVIGDLIASVQAQTYPACRINIFVMADNCTDDTAGVAARAGAVVYTRQSTSEIGKGYALDALLSHIREDYPTGFDGYFVFDADNILTKTYIEEMDRTFRQGYEIVTGYRNSKNYGDNWISAGYALWFLRESRYLNYARDALGTSCAISGTGFLFSRAVAEEMSGWPYHLLTEDIEFTADQVSKGRQIGFCETAELFDEQPVQFSQSWRQRTRWAKGALQVTRHYGGQLLAGITRGSFACYDMTMATMPAFILSVASIFCNLLLGIWGGLIGDSVWIAVRSIGGMLARMYLTMLVIGAITTATEWSHIRAGSAKKIGALFSFPIFMFTYIPIAFCSLFARPSWKPIAHRVTAEQAALQTGQGGEASSECNVTVAR